MMHAVGFFHEQSRTDRDDFITIMWNNIQPGMQGQFEKYGQTTIQYLGTDYDFASIMHYGPKAFSRNGLPTIVPKKKATIGQRSGFSKVDAYKINALYGCPTNGKPPPPPVEGGGVTGPTIQTTTAKPGPQPGPPTAKVIIPLVKPTASTTSKPYPSPPTLPTVKSVVTSTIPPPPSIPECKNTRPDCDQLAQQGWCRRNPHWMKDNCPISCGFCKPPPECEDLRVDCPELVKKRYCILAPKYMKNYCSKSCGFCTVTPVTEVPDTGLVTRGIQSVNTTSTTIQPSVVTRGPLVTFWPTI
uniref:Metalloendopeptidase n=1 Tax=Acrobeloides nanus TaxID=290746 RepID=A0A914CWC3_9BILA